MSEQKGQSSIVAPHTYSVRLAVKTPSRNVQYRMLEADVTVTGNDFEALRTEATKALTQAIADVSIMMGEAPPDELKESLSNIYGKEEIDEVYGLEYNEAPTTHVQYMR